MKKLICIYTCETDKKSLCNFKQTNLYKKLQNDTNTKILEVYAGSNKTQILENKLLLKCEEDYTGLSIKTYKMISKCVKHFDFDVLIKIDCNILEYKNSYGLNLNIKQQIYNETYILNTIKSDYINCRYGGSAVSFVSDTSTLKTWATHKNLKLQYKRMNYFDFPFFCGKFYFLSKNFCEKIINKGKQDNIFFNENLGPAEDVYIGYVLNKNITINDKIKIFSSYLAFNDLNNEFTKKLKNTIEQYKQKQNFEMEHCVT